MKKNKNLEALLEEMDAAEESDTAEVKQPRPRDKRRRNIRVTSIAITAVVAVVVILLNVVMGLVADRYPITVDLTEDAVYSLSEEGIAIAEQIKKDVTVTFFMDEDILKAPATGDDFQDTVLRQMHAFIYEYASRAEATVTVHYVDLTENPSLAGEYEMSVASGGVLFRCDKKERYFALKDMIYYEQVPNYATMSYDYEYYSLVEKTFATGFLSVISEADLQIGFLTGNGEKSTTISDMTSLYESNGYKVHQINFATAAEIPEGCKVLIIAGANVDFSDTQIERLTQWLHNGGKKGRHLYVLCDPEAKEMTNLYEFLDVYYGIQVTDKIIYETDANKLVSATMPTFPLVEMQANELLEGMEGAQVLMGTSVALNTRFENDPDNLLVFNTDMLVLDNKTAKLQTVVTGEDGKPTTELLDASEPIIGMAMACDWNIVNNENVNTYVFVSGGYYTVDPMFFSAMFANEALVTDVMNTMCDNDIKVTVKAFSVDNEALTYTVGEALTLGLGVFTLGVPLALLVIGLVMFIRRRHL